MIDIRVEVISRTLSLLFTSQFNKIFHVLVSSIKKKVWEHVPQLIIEVSIKTILTVLLFRGACGYPFCFYWVYSINSYPKKRNELVKKENLDQDWSYKKLELINKLTWSWHIYKILQYLRVIVRSNFWFIINPCSACQRRKNKF